MCPQRSGRTGQKILSEIIKFHTAKEAYYDHVHIPVVYMNVGIKKIHNFWLLIRISRWLFKQQFYVCPRISILLMMMNLSQGEECPEHPLGRRRKWCESTHQILLASSKPVFCMVKLKGCGTLSSALAAASASLISMDAENRCPGDCAHIFWIL